MVGRTILHYRIVGVLGAGGMGVVYEAHDSTLDRAVALKFLPAELAADHAALERFQREARAASALNHPAICTIHAFEQAETDEGVCHFLVLERLEGQSLDRVLTGSPLTVEHALELGIQVADALDAAHTRGILHRDIKPANIFVQPRNRAKILDFGLAKLAAARVGETVTVEPFDMLTSPGTTLGTIAYMSPEQARGEELDARTDLFSFGAVLSEMCTGRPPFAGKTSAVIFQKILDKDPEPPRALNPALSSRLEGIVLKALEKDRDLRCQSAAELRADLKRLQRDATAGRHADAGADSDRQPLVVSNPSLSITAPTSSGAVLIAEVKRHKIGVGEAATALLALLVAAGFGVYRAVTGDRSTPGTSEALSIASLTTSGDVRGCTNSFATSASVSRIVSPREAPCIDPLLYCSW
jgi:serine/threonine protein kinase